MKQLYVAVVVAFAIAFPHISSALAPTPEKLPVPVPVPDVSPVIEAGAQAGRDAPNALAPTSSVIAPTAGAIVSSAGAPATTAGALATTPGAEVAAIAPPGILHLSGEKDLEQLSRALATRLGGAVPLLELEPEQLDALRWTTPDPERGECQALGARLLASHPWHESVTAPTAIGDLTVKLIDQAFAQQLDSNPEETLEALTLAFRMLPCTGGLLTPKQVRALYLYGALAHLWLNDGRHHEAFQRMLAVNPVAYLEPDYPERIRRVFLEEVVVHMKQRPQPVSPAGLAPDTWIDGVAAETLEELSPGEHIAQLRLPSGDIRTRQWTLTQKAGAGARQAVPLAQVISFGAPSQEEARAALARAVLQGSLEAHQQAWLRRYLEGHHLPLVGLEAGPGPGGVLHVRVFDLEQGLLGEEASVARYQALLAARPMTDGPDTARAEAPQPAPVRDRLEAGLGVAAQYLPDLAGAFQHNDRASGAALWIDVPLRRVVLGVRLAAYPAVASPRIPASEDGACVSLEGASPSQRAACTPLAVAAGVSYRKMLGERLYVLPGLFVQGQLLPETLIFDFDGEVAGTSNAWVGGLSVRNRFGYGLTRGRARLTVGLELSAGAGYGWIHFDDLEQTSQLFAVSLGAQLGVGGRW